MIERQIVHIVMIGGFEDTHIGGVFSTREAAAVCLAEKGGETYGDFGCLDHIYEWEVDGDWVRTFMPDPANPPAAPAG